MPALSLGVLAVSGLASGVSWFFYSRAPQLGPVARVTALEKLSVVLIAVLALVFQGEPLELKGWIGIVLMAGGAALVAWIKLGGVVVAGYRENCQIVNWINDATPSLCRGSRGLRGWQEKQWRKAGMYLPLPSYSLGCNTKYLERQK